MIDLIWIFLPMILVLGIITSYTDIKYGKIRNKWIIISLTYFFISYLFIIIYIKVSGSMLVSSYIFETLINFLVSIVIGVVFWLRNYWNAADGKLFIVFSALVPISVYRYGIIKYFLAFNILVNSFILLAIVLVFQLIFKIKLKYLKDMKKLFTFNKLFNLFALLFILHWFSMSFFNLIGIRRDLFFSLLFILIFMPLFSKIASNKSILVALILSRILFDKTIFNLSFIRSYSSITLIYILIVFFIQRLSNQVFSYNVKVEKLKEGMVLGKYIIKKDSWYRLVDPMVDEGTNYDYLVAPTPEGLNGEDLKKIEDMRRKNLLKFDSINVLNHTFFAPHLFLGTIFTIIFQGNILAFLVQQIP